ncbi:hypothetical protein DOY81_003117 [Sarcophaga bullata]|nr:hypothetical protein DOY81_003117 [Sarcophaga bullata]
MELKRLPEIKCGEMIMKLDLGEPSETAKVKALKELRETSENRANGLRELKRLLEVNCGLLLLTAETNIKVPMTDEWLMKYLRCCKFYPESARDLVIRNCKLYLKYPEVKSLLTLKKLKHAIYDHNLVYLMPQRDQHGRRIILSLAGKQWDTKFVTVDELYSASTLITELAHMEPETQINGLVYIIDLSELTFTKALQFTPTKVIRVLDFIQGNIPGRVKGLHIVNQPRIFQPIFSAAKAFFTTKYGSRIQMHGTNYESLHQYIAPECLPKRYGGLLDMELSYGRETYQLLEPFEDYFEELQTCGFK